MWAILLLQVVTFVLVVCVGVGLLAHFGTMHREYLPENRPGFREEGK